MNAITWNCQGAIWWLLMLGLWCVLFFDDAARTWDAHRQRRRGGEQ